MINVQIVYCEFFKFSKGYKKIILAVNARNFTKISKNTKL